jgi:hypothetical protein
MKNNIRRTGKPNSGKASAHRAELRIKAAERLLAYSLLTREERIAKLDAGNFRALKQRAKLNADIA